jgi:hypothetical protein
MGRQRRLARDEVRHACDVGIDVHEQGSERLLNAHAAHPSHRVHHARHRHAARFVGVAGHERYRGA